MTTSPLIERVESIFSLEGELSSLGYTSVFDVAKIPRERFVKLHRGTLGIQAGAIYDLAIGYALQVAQKYRHGGVTTGIDAAVRGVFSRPGPDYPNQFLDKSTGWKINAPSGAPEANDGPVAYLSYIYKRAVDQEKAGDATAMNTLAQRRPDIGNLLIDDAAINEEVSQLQLVNEVLTSAIKGTSDFQGVSDVNSKFDTERYPNFFPYSFANRQIVAAQSTLNVEIEDYLLAQNPALLPSFWSSTKNLNDAQAEDLTRLQIMASGLSSEQQNIVVEPPWFAAGTNNGPGFYEKNFGSAALTVSDFASIDTLCSHTGLTVPEVEQMLCVTAGQDNVIRSGNCPAEPEANPGVYGARFVNAMQINSNGSDYISIEKQKDGTLVVNSLTDDRMDRINRMVRLKKWLDLPFEDVDLLVSSLVADAQVSSQALMDDHVLRLLGVYRHYRKAHSVSVKAFAAWFSHVTPYAVSPEAPFFDRIFNGGNGFDAPLVADNQNFDCTATSGDDGARIQKICAALQLSRDEFLTIAAALMKTRGVAQLCCNLDHLSAFYRIASLSGTLGVAVIDLLAIVDLMDGNTGYVWADLFIASISSINLFQALSHVALWFKNRRLSAESASIMLTPRTELISTGIYRTANVKTEYLNDFSFSWSDVVVDDNSGYVYFTQRIDFSPNGDQWIYPVSYALPDGLSLNGYAYWATSDSLSEINKDYAQQWGIQKDFLYTMDNYSKAVGGVKYAICIPLKIKRDKLSTLRQMSPEVYLSVNVTVKAGSVRVAEDSMIRAGGMSMQGTAYQLAFIQDVWRLLGNTLVNSALFQRSGAPLINNSQKPIDWLQLLTASKLVDGAGLVTDAASDTVNVTGIALPVIKVIRDVVNGQALTATEKTQAMVALNAAIVQARRTQTGVATSLLAQTLNVTQSLSALLLRWVGQTPYQFLRATWALKSAVNAAVDIPGGYLTTLEETARCALLCQHFSVSPAALEHLLDYPHRFGVRSAHSGDVTLASAYLLGRYEDLLHRIGAANSGTEDDVLAFLDLANSPAPQPETAAGLLARMLGWKREAVLDCWTVLGGVAKTVADLDSVMRMQQAEVDTGLTVSQQRQAFILDRSFTYAAWQAVGQAMVAGANRVTGMN